MPRWDDLRGSGGVVRDDKFICRGQNHGDMYRQFNGLNREPVSQDARI